MNHLLGAPGACAWRGRARGAWLICGLALLVLGPCRAFDPRAVSFSVWRAAGAALPWGCSCGFGGSQPNTRLCVMTVTHARFRSQSCLRAFAPVVGCGRAGARPSINACACSPSATFTATSRRPRRSSRRARRPTSSPPSATSRPCTAGLERTVSELSAIKCPTLLVPGNNETEDEPSRRRGGLGELNRRPRRERRDRRGAVLRPRGRDPDHAVGLELRPRGGRGPRRARALPGRRPCCWSTRRPTATATLGPRVVISAAGRSLAAIERHEPPLVLCGHIHESWGQESTIGPSRVVNLGPWGTLIDL